MLGNISTPLLVVCLAASVAGSALVRNKRSWDPLETDPYGHCGKPTNHILHGGIKLFPVIGIDDPHDNSCNRGDLSWLFCEPKFYCDDGYKVNGDFHLLCVHNNLTDDYKWEGNIPTCDWAPYGYCGKPTNHILNGGIKLFPVTDIDDQHDNSCNTGDPSWLFCEPKFYCDDGFKMNGDFHLLCVHNNLTGDYKWEGQIPTCVESKSGHRVVFFVVPGIGLLISFIFAVCAALRSSSGYARFDRSNI